MGRLARIVAMASIGAIAFSAGSLISPDLSSAGPRRPAAKSSKDEVKSLARAIELEIGMRGLNGPKNLYPFFGANGNGNDENKWSVKKEPLDPKRVAVIFPAHMGLLQRGYYDDVLIASAPLLNSLNFYQVRRAQYSLSDIRGTLKAGIPNNYFNFLNGAKGEELARHPLKFSGLEDGTALQRYLGMQELARFIGSKRQTPLNLKETEAEIARLYESIGAHNLPEYSKDIWGNGKEYRAFMHDLRLRIHEAEKQRMSDAAKIGAGDFKGYKGQEQLAIGYVWHPLYMRVLSEELAAAGVSRIVVTSGVNDYFTWNARMNNPFMRVPEPAK